MFIYILLYLIQFSAVEETETDEKTEEKPDQKTEDIKKSAAIAACPSFSTIELVPGDKEAAKIEPEDSIVAEEMRNKGLVPIRSIVVFMRPDSEYPLCGMPENLLLIYKRLLESVGDSVQSTGINFALMKGTLGKLIKHPETSEDKEEKEDEKDEKKDEKGEDKKDEEKDKGEAETE